MRRFQDVEPNEDRSIHVAYLKIHWVQAQVQWESPSAGRKGIPFFPTG